MKTVSRHAFVLLLAGVSLSHAQDGTSRTVALTGGAAPGLGGNFYLLADPVINGSGAVSFLGFSNSGHDGIYKTSGTSLVLIASTQQNAPGLVGAFSDFNTPVINESGTVAFSGTTLAQATGVYTGTGGALTTIAAHGQTAPGLAGTISGFSTGYSLSDSGAVGYRADVTLGTVTNIGVYVGSGGTPAAMATTVQTAPGTGGLFGSFSAPISNNTGTSAFVQQNGSIYGVYAATGGTLTTVANTLQAAPEMGGNFSAFTFGPAINDNGTIAFYAFGSAPGARGIFARTGGVLTAIASTARAAPGLGGNFTALSEPALGNSGIIAFRGQAAGGQGIYTGTGGALQTVARSGQAAPSLTGVFSTFGKPTINDLGITAFQGNTATGTGIYLGDGQQLVTVAFKGQSFLGSTISNIIFSGGTDRGGSSQINNNGQVAYKVALANGTTTIQVFTPTLHYRAAAGGSWAARSNWTLGLLPAAVHDIVIDPASPLTITGPTLPTTIRSLAINGSGANTAELTLQSAGSLTTTNGASTGASGRLAGSGRLNSALTSAGTIAPGLATSAGSISIGGNVTLQSTAHLAFDLGGLVRKTGYDFLGVTGLLTLGGTLDVSLLGGFAPQIGNTFDLFDATSLAGTFGSINLPTLTGGRAWDTSLLSTTGVISVAGLSVTPTTYTLAASASAATIHAGGSATITATIVNTGAAGADTLSYTGLDVLASPTGGNLSGVTLSLANSALPSGNTSQSGTTVFSSGISGTYTLTPVVASALNGTLGGAATNAGATTTAVSVFSGSAKWIAPAAASWGAGSSASWTDTASALVHAAPGTFAGFRDTDSALFDGTTAGSIVTLDGTSPSLSALTFTGGSYTIAEGTGGKLKLDNDDDPATITDSGGSHTISAHVELESDLIATVSNAADTLTLSGGISGSENSLTKTGAGKLVLGGDQDYASLFLNGGTTEITGSFTSGTTVVHANTSVTFAGSQTFASLIIGAGVEVTFGGGAPSFAAPFLKPDSAVIPEPGSAGLLLLGALGILARRQRQ